MSDVQPWVINDFTQIITAIGVILTALSSLWNRYTLGKVESKVDKAVVVASETKDEAIKVHGDLKQAVQETKEAAIAVNAEVVKEVHEAGVAAGQAMNDRDKL